MYLRNLTRHIGESVFVPQLNGLIGGGWPVFMSRQSGHIEEVWPMFIQGSVKVLGKSGLCS